MAIFSPWLISRHCCNCLFVKVCLTLQPHGLQPTRLLYPWDFSDKNTGVGCHFFLPFSRGSAQFRDQSCVSCIAGRFFIIWATREGVFTLSSHSTLAPEVRCDETMGGLSRLSVQDQVAPASHGHLSPVMVFSDPVPCCDTEGARPEPWLRWG